jgi:hypothetical protein
MQTNRAGQAACTCFSRVSLLSTPNARKSGSFSPDRLPNRFPMLERKMRRNPPVAAIDHSVIIEAG